MQLYGRKLAAIDIGSNAIRLVIAKQLSDKSFKRLEFVRFPLRLGKDVFANKMHHSINMH